MSNTKLFTKTIEIVPTSNKGATRFIIFEDQSLKLEMDIDYDAQNKISKISFSGQNIGGYKYNLKHITWCKQSFEFEEHLLLHMDHSGTPNSSFSKNLDSSTPNDQIIIDKVNLSKGQLALFLFKVYSNPITPSTPITCNLNFGTPETKDGTIVIGI